MEVILLIACRGQALQDSQIAAPIEDLCQVAASRVNLQVISLVKEEVLETKATQVELDKITMARAQEEAPLVSNQDQITEISQIRTGSLLAPEERIVVGEATRKRIRRIRTSMKTAAVKNVKNTSLEAFHSLVMKTLQVTMLRGAFKMKN